MDLVALEAQAPRWHHWVRGVLAVLVAQADLELRRDHLFPMGQTNREYFGLYRVSKFLKKKVKSKRCLFNGDKSYIYLVCAVFDGQRVIMQKLTRNSVYTPLLQSSSLWPQMCSRRSHLTPPIYQSCLPSSSVCPAYYQMSL